MLPSRPKPSSRVVPRVDGDRLRRDALLWNFTVLGEAATLVSAGTKARFPGIPWRNPARLRNRVVHGYWSVDVGVLHTTASDQLGDFACPVEPPACLTGQGSAASQMSHSTLAC